MPRKSKREEEAEAEAEADNGNGGDELHQLAVKVAAEVLEEDSDAFNEKVHDAVKEWIGEKMEDIDEQIKTEVGDKLEELDLDQIKTDAIAAAVKKAIEALAVAEEE
jgi:serine/threonine protein phosphatase PrpC